MNKEEIMENINLYLYENKIIDSTYPWVKYDNEDNTFYINIAFLTNKLENKVNPYWIWSESSDDYYCSDCYVVINTVIPQKHIDYINNLLPKD